MKYVMPNFLAIILVLSMSAGHAEKQNGQEPAAKSHSKADIESDSRADVRQRLLVATLNKMLDSTDAIAVMLASKHARQAGKKVGEERSEAEQNERQANSLGRALELVKTERERAQVEFEVALFCMGFIDLKLCQGEDRVLKYGQNHPENAVAWIMVAAREFARGFHPEAQIFLALAAKSDSTDWFYRDALQVALKYARELKQPGAVLGDAEVVAFDIAGQLTIPAFSRLSQMCNPDPTGKLPDGRYEACHRIAKIMIDHGQTNVELSVGYRVEQRLAEGEKNEAAGKEAGAKFAALQAANKFLWEKNKYPPVSIEDAKALVNYVVDVASVGEVKATRNGLARMGKSVDDFQPQPAVALETKK